jgi:hypothetical protein
MCCSRPHGRVWQLAMWATGPHMWHKLLSTWTAAQDNPTNGLLFSTCQKKEPGQLHRANQPQKCCCSAPPPVTETNTCTATQDTPSKGAAAQHLQLSEKANSVSGPRGPPSTQLVCSCSYHLNSTCQCFLFGSVQHAPPQLDRTHMTSKEGSSSPSPVAS